MPLLSFNHSCVPAPEPSGNRKRRQTDPNSKVSATYDVVLENTTDVNAAIELVKENTDATQLQQVIQKVADVEILEDSFTAVTSERFIQHLAI